MCEAHRRPGDEPIAGELLVRRVSLTAEVVFSAVYGNPGDAKAEAVIRLLEAVQSAGGVMNLCASTVQVGRYAVPRAAVTANASGRDRQ